MYFPIRHPQPQRQPHPQHSTVSMKRWYTMSATSHTSRSTISIMFIITIMMMAIGIIITIIATTNANAVTKVEAFHSPTTVLNLQHHRCCHDNRDSPSPQQRMRQMRSFQYFMYHTKQITSSSTSTSTCILYETNKINGADHHEDQNPTTTNYHNQSSIKSNEIVARRIVVKGDVQGGYYRSCVLNEAGKFRRLVGTMSPIDLSSDEAEIYVEGKLHMVEGFIRWCQRSKVGLNQIITVKDVFEEEPTGMYDDFDAPTAGIGTTN